MWFNGILYPWLWGSLYKIYTLHLYHTFIECDCTKYDKKHNFYGKKLLSDFFTTKIYNFFWILNFKTHFGVIWLRNLAILCICIYVLYFDGTLNNFPRNLEIFSVNRQPVYLWVASCICPDLQFVPILNYCELSAWILQIYTP